MRYLRFTAQMHSVYDPQTEAKPVKRASVPVRLSAMLIAFGSTLAAQTAPAATSPATEQAVVLSPFTVSTDRDTGYAAQETLAGTRLRTSLRDVGSPMTVITKELIEDLGATSVQDALIFTPSVDTYVAGTGAGQTGESYRYESGRPFTVRGFVQSNLASTDFFNVVASPDSYNQERLTLSRGPNSILFGVGGAGGAAVISTKRAVFGQNVHSVQLGTDNFGSYRGSFDYNQVVLPQRLAVRLNALEEEKHGFRDNEGRINHRYTLGVTYRPLRDTTVTANFESYRFGNNYVPTQWVFDGGVLRWTQAGRPTAQTPVTAQLTAAQKLAFDPKSVLVQNTAQSLIYANGIGLGNPIINYRYEVTPDLDRFNAATGVRAQTYDPQALYGIARDFSPAFGTFSDPAYWANGKWGQVFIEQKLWRGAFLEIAGNLSQEDSSVVPASSTTVSIDTSKYLPDGSANPGYGLPYLNTGSLGPVWVVYDRKTSQGRATFSYDFDLTRKNKWLGRHQFAALGQLSNTERWTDNKYLVNLASPNQNGFGIPTAGNNRIGFRQYLVNGSIPFSLGPREAVQMLDQINRQTTAIGATAVERAPLKAALRNADAAQTYLEKATALSLALQSRWLDNRLVTTFGVRRDAVDAFVPASYPLDSAGYYMDAKQVAPPSLPTFRDAGKTRTAGAVLRVTEWFDLTANRSNNFSPAGRSNQNFDGGLLGPQRGKTRDYGMRVLLFEQKLVFSLNKFTSAGENIATAGNPAANPINSIFTRLQTNYGSRGDSHFADMPTTILSQQPLLLWSTRNNEARGYEASLTFNPNRNWRIMLSGSQNENVNGPRWDDIRRYYYTNQTKYTGIDTYKKFAAELAKVAAGQRSSSFDLDPANPVHVTQAATDATFINGQVTTAETLFANEQALVGTVTSVNGKYAANGVATYTFDSDGRFKGFALGGNFRFRDPPVVGYHPVLNASGVPTGLNNLSRPIYGANYFDLGVMASYGWKFSRALHVKLQLNVDNPLNWQSPRLVSVGTDTDGIYGTQYALVPLRWEMRVPRTMRLTATFTF